MGKTDILIITGEPFPIGMAATNRIISYAKELAKVRNVKLCTYNKPKEDTQLFGEFEGIEYYYTGKEKKDSANKFVRGYRLYKRKFLVLNEILKNRPKVIIYMGFDLQLCLLIKIICLMFHMNLYNEINEAWPLCISNKMKRYFITRLHSLFDGMIVMTKNIREYFSFMPDDKFFLLPMSVDISRFQNIERIDKHYFFYAGANLERDGVLDILNGFIEFSKINFKYELWLAFPSQDNSYYRRVVDLINSCECNDRIKLLGQVSSDKIPYLMRSATALLTTPHKDYKTGGFPTKLGEYLVSEVPTIVSSIPSLLEYLDETDTFWVKPNSPKEITEAMRVVVFDKEKVDKIVSSGLQVVKNKFLMSNYINDLIVFLNL